MIWKNFVSDSVSLQHMILDLGKNQHEKQDRRARWRLGVIIGLRGSSRILFLFRKEIHLGRTNRKKTNLCSVEIKSYVRAYFRLISLSHPKNSFVRIASPLISDSISLVRFYCKRKAVAQHTKSTFSSHKHDMKQHKNNLKARTLN